MRRMQACARHGFQDEALAVFGEWRDRERAAGHRPDTFVANAALHAQREDPRAGRALFEELRREGLAADAVTYNTLMTALSRALQPGQVDALYEDMRWADVAPDFRTFAIMGAAHARVGDLTRALMVGEQMRALGTWDQSEYWLVVLGAFAARRDAENALTLWFKLRRAAAFGGSPVRRVLCNTMLRCFVESRRGDKALELLAEMRSAAAGGGEESAGAPPLVEGPCETSYAWGIAAYGCLGERGATAGDLAGADALFAEFVALHCPPESGTSPRSSTYRALLGVCAAAGQPTRAQELVLEMGSGGRRGDCTGLVLQAQAGAGRLSEALETFEGMRSGGAVQRPDPQSCRVLLSSLREAGRLGEAVGVLKFMQGRRIPVAEAELAALTRECADLALAEGGGSGGFSMKVAVQLQQALWRSPPEGASSQLGAAFLQLRDKSVAEARVDLLKELGALKSRGSSGGGVGETGRGGSLVISVAGAGSEAVLQSLRHLLKDQLGIEYAEAAGGAEGERLLRVGEAELEGWISRGQSSVTGPSDGTLGKDAEGEGG